MSLAILVPVLGRPHRVKPLLESIAEATPEPHVVLFICDPDDADEKRAIWAQGGTLIEVDGNYPAKINAGVRSTEHLFVFLGADDLHFHPGWFEIARDLMAAGIGVAGTQDLCNRRVIAGEHSTHSLVARWYTELGTIDEPDKLLHEGYEHEYVDDEFVETAKHRGAFVFANDSVVEHLHPDVGKAPKDRLYRAQGERMRRTRHIYDARRPLWT